MRIKSAVLAAVLVVSLVGAAAAPAATQQAEGEAYSGAFVQFQTNSNAVADYAVDGSVVVENVTAQSASETDGGIGIGASSSTAIDGSGVSSQNSAGARASVSFESGTDMEANDNQRGVITFTSTDGEQVVQANVSGDAQAEDDNRVVVTSDDGAQGTFILIGDGNVTTSEDGRVMASVREDSQLVYRQYNEERSEADRKQERMIQNGTATAEAYVYGAAEAEGDDDTATETESNTDDAEARGTSVVEYGQDTTVEVQERSQNRVNMTVERTERQGKVVIATVSESAVENAESLEVYVDGEAAAQANSYGEVQQATQDGDESRYLVRQSSSAEAATDVVIGINHFSERQVSMQSDGENGGDSETETETETDSMNDDSETETETEDDGSSGDGAGFGIAAALVALAATLVAVRSRL